MKLESLQCGNIVISEISYGFTSFHIFIAYTVTLYIFSEMGKSEILGFLVKYAVFEETLQNIKVGTQK